MNFKKLNCENIDFESWINNNNDNNNNNNNKILKVELIIIIIIIIIRFKRALGSISIISLSPLSKNHHPQAQVQHKPKSKSIIKRTLGSISIKPESISPSPRPFIKRALGSSSIKPKPNNNNNNSGACWEAQIPFYWVIWNELVREKVMGRKMGMKQWVWWLWVHAWDEWYGTS